MARALALLITATGAVHVKELEHLNRSGQEAEKLNRSGEETGNEPCCICSPDKYGDAHGVEPNSIFGCFPCFKVHMEKGSCSFAAFEKKVIKGKYEQGKYKGKYKQFQRVRAREWWLFGMEQCEALTGEGEPATKEQEKELAPPFMHAMCYLPALERFIEEVQRKERLLSMGKEKCEGPNKPEFALSYCTKETDEDLVEAYKKAEETRKWKYCRSPTGLDRWPLLGGREQGYRSGENGYRFAKNGGGKLTREKAEDREEKVRQRVKEEEKEEVMVAVGLRTDFKATMWRRTNFGGLEQAFNQKRCLNAEQPRDCNVRWLKDGKEQNTEKALVNRWNKKCILLEEDDAVAKFRVGLCQKEKCTRFMEGRKPEKTKEQRDGELEAKEAADKVALNRFFGGPKKDLRTDAPAGDSSTK